MSDASLPPLGPPAPLRLWPGVALALVLAPLWLGVPLLLPSAASVAILGGAAGGLAIGLWWLFFSRAPWSERIGGIAFAVVAVFAAKRLVHPSIANGMMGLMLPIFALPALGLALVAGAVAGRSLTRGRRRAVLAAALLLAAGAFTLLRTEGMTGASKSELCWRWTSTAEERLLAAARATPPPAAATAPSVPSSTANVATGVVQWPGFRGPDRDGVVRGVRIATDWSATPPKELWRRPVGPGWSSFAVAGDFVFTQEQRGDDEVVSCYRLATGAPVWSHTDPARFWESNAGAGPRGTPTLAHGRVYSSGATGLLNALDARTGAVVWSRNPAADHARKVPEWGFACSPLVVGDAVVIAAAGLLAAYDAATGAPLWVGPKGGWGYSSPHLATLSGVAQVVLLNGAGVIGIASSDGQTLWSHDWKNDGIVQPVLLADGDILLGSGSGLGAKVGVNRIGVRRGPSGWSVEERWTSLGVKPYFNDFVAHAGHAYGFDKNDLACIDLADGQRRWKGGRYGHGQLIALADQNLLIVLAETGDLALVRALPDQFTELARIPAIRGKTWNHPVLAGDTLLVRNSEEMAAFRLAPATDR